MAEEEAKAKKAGKSRTLNLIKSLDPNDDDRTSISKRLSWILRHGARSVGVNLDADGWISMSDLLKIDILDDVAEDKLLSVIIDSNGRKLRYEIKKTGDATSIRAYSEKERRQKDKVSGVPEEKRAPRAKDKAAPKDKAKKEKPEKSEKAASKEEKDKGLRSSAAVFVPGGEVPTAAAAPAATSAPSAVDPTSVQLAQAQAAQAHAAAIAAWQWSQMYAPMMAGYGAWDGSLPGRIKSFNAEKGFGFIECPYTFSQYNRDVFLHKAQIGDLKVGATVTFKCEVNKQGMPQAKDVHATNLPPQMQAAFAAPGKGKGKDGGKGKGKGKDKGKEKGAKSGKKGKEKKDEAAGEDAGEEKKEEATEEKKDEKKEEGGEAAPAPEAAPKEGDAAGTA